MNIVQSLLSRLGRDDDEDLTPEEEAELAAQERQERIDYHRRSVRTGPVKVSHPSTGQARRQVARDQRSQQRKAAKRHRKAWLRAQLDKASLRGRLQSVDLLPGQQFPSRLTEEAKIRTFAGLERDFGGAAEALELYKDILGREAEEHAAAMRRLREQQARG